MLEESKLTLNGNSNEKLTTVSYKWENSEPFYHDVKFTDFIEGYKLSKNKAMDNWIDDSGYNVFHTAFSVTELSIDGNDIQLIELCENSNNKTPLQN